MKVVEFSFKVCQKKTRAATMCENSISENEMEQDPFQYPLWEYLLRELTFQHLKSSEVKAFYMVSPLWNQIASESTVSSSKLKLAIKLHVNATWIDVNERLDGIISNGREYTELSLETSRYCEISDFSKPKLFDVFNIVGSSLRKLKISCRNLDYNDLREILTPLQNLEEVELLQTVDGDFNEILPLRFPKLQVLKIHGSSRSSALKLFENVTTLVSFKLQPKQVDLQVRAIGDFIMRQNGLKHLHVNYGFDNNEALIPRHRLNEIHFQLETMEAFMRDVEFFDGQNSLKDVYIHNSYRIYLFADNPERYGNFLGKILSMPTLNVVRFEFGSIRHGNFEYLNAIRNSFIKQVEYNESCGSVVEGFIEIFPRLEKIFVKDFESSVLKFMPINQLRLVQSTTEIEEFNYVTIDENNEEENYETSILEFIKNHPSIRKLSIGRPSWISRRFSVSLNFCKLALLLLPRLDRVYIYNPRESSKLIQMLLSSKYQNSFKEVRLYVNSNEQDVSEMMKREIDAISWLTTGRLTSDRE